MTGKCLVTTDALVTTYFFTIVNRGVENGVTGKCLVTTDALERTITFSL